MLKLILGRAGSGKTDYIMNEIQKLVQKGEKGITLIVPEQFSHEAERAVCRKCGDKINLYGEVLSFSRLCSRVFAQTGGAADRILDNGGRILLMRKAMSSVSPFLKVYGKNERQSGFIEKMLAAVDEFKTSCISAQDIYKVFENINSPLGDKMRDIAAVYGAYEAMLSLEITDANDRMTRLACKIGDSTYCSFGHIFIDGFMSFTHQQMDVIQRILKSGVDVTIAITCSGLLGREEHFEEARSTADSLINAAQGQTSVIEMPGQKNGFSGLIEKYLFSGQPDKTEGSEHVHIYKAQSESDECEFAAGKIIELVNNGYQYGDIVLVCCSPAQVDLAENMLKKYDIPVYVNRKTDILATAPVSLINSVLDIITSNWEYSAVFRYLKTGLTGFSPNEIDELENYVIKWNIRGSMWTQNEDWAMHPEGFVDNFRQQDVDKLERINAIRKMAAQPVAELQAEIENAKCASEQVRALYSFLIKIEFPQRLMMCKERDIECVYDQLWDIIVSAMEQFDESLADETFTAEEFSSMWSLLMSQYDVGKIPVLLNNVMLGEISKTFRREIKHLIVIGASDNALPQVPQSAGILSDFERDEAVRMGLELPVTSKGRVYRSLYDIYACFTQPEESLTISYCGEAGQRPSFICQRICYIFNLEYETCDVTSARTFAEKPCFELAAGQQDEPIARAARAYYKTVPEYAGRLEAVMRASRSERGYLSKESAKKLYGRKINISASKVDKYYECKYKYFMQYGLRAKPRKAAGFDAPVYGTFIHYILENVTREITSAGSFADVSEKECKNLTAKYVDKYVQDVLLNFSNKSERFKYLFNRLVDDAERIVTTMVRELSDSEFIPLDFELELGKSSQLVPPELTDGETQMVIEGFVDRVDGWIHDGKLYLRVVDYKTGVKSLSLSNIWYGMGLQMLIYLFAIERCGEKYYGKPIVPAGVLYAPAREGYLSVSRNISDEELAKERVKAVRRSGLVLNDEEVINAMAHDDGKAYLPVRFTKDGAAVGDSLATIEQLGALAKHIDNKLIQIGRELHSGQVVTDPFYRNQVDNACQFCDYRQACHFDEENGDRVRYLSKLKTHEAWQKMMEEGKL